ncbi:GNAT family N-acetyltransferase [Dongia mobilis]|jgi:ribosomal-protein-alanine N-acetyltransferase|uniref:GNAT family N-acetyltransferase n=1 Tax=Dongia sp. TaxID=1977262 RepID=UPI0026E957FD
MLLPTLTTPRLTLRQLAMSDAPVLHEWLSDPEVMRYWSTLPHTDIAQTEAWVQSSLDAMAKGEAQDFAVLFEGRVIGRIAFWQGDEIGFLFDPRMQGKGFAGEALRAIAAYGFETLGFTEIRADVDPGNAASLRLLERAGFVRTGAAERTFEIGGKWFDSVYLSLQRP